MYTEKTIFEFLKAFQKRETSKLDHGWTYSNTFQVFQKVNNQIYCYVTPQFDRFIAQTYKRSETGLCELEARCYKIEHLPHLFALCDEWLDKYGNDNSKLPSDPFAIGVNFKDRLFEEMCIEKSKEPRS